MLIPGSIVSEVQVPAAGRGSSARCPSSMSTIVLPRQFLSALSTRGEIRRGMFAAPRGASYASSSISIHHTL